jgi:hypothetical protein
MVTTGAKFDLSTRKRSSPACPRKKKTRKRSAKTLKMLSLSQLVPCKGFACLGSKMLPPFKLEGLQCNFFGT